MSDSNSIGGFAAAMAQSLYEQSKTVGEQVNATIAKQDQVKQKVTDNALQVVQQSTQARQDILRIGRMIDLYA